MILAMSDVKTPCAKLRDPKETWTELNDMTASRTDVVAAWWFSGIAFMFFLCRLRFGLHQRKDE